MSKLETLMDDLLLSVQAGAGSQRASAPVLDYAARKRREELAQSLRLIPSVPPNWRQLVHERILQAISTWAWGDGNLVLLGDTGRGKTLGAAALARRLLREVTTDGQWHRARRVLFVDAARLAVAREQHGLGEGEAPLVQRCMDTPLLFLDEMGYLDKCTGVIDQVIDTRNKTGLPIVATSGLEPRDLGTRYGSATARKLMAGRPRDKMVQVFQADGSE
jgi:hypothetical protein